MKFLLVFIMYSFLLLSPILGLKPYLEEKYPRYALKRERIKHQMDHKAFLIGSSHANSVDRKTLSKGLGISVSKQNRGGRDIFEIIYQIKSIKRHAKGSKLFVLPFSHYFCYYDNDAYIVKGKRLRREIRVRVYAEYENIMSTISGDIDNMCYALMYPVVSEDHLKLLFVKTDTIKKEKIRKECDPINKREQLNKQTEKRIKNIFSSYLVNMVANADYDIPDRSSNELIAVLKENQNDLFLIYSPPYWPLFSDSIPQKINNKNAELLARISELPNVIYYDLHDILVVYNPCSFLNPDHLSHHGAKQFTEQLVEIIGKDPKYLAWRSQHGAADLAEKKDAVAKAK